jgi:hypothetical protein
LEQLATAGRLAAALIEASLFVEDTFKTAIHA